MWWNVSSMSRYELQWAQLGNFRTLKGWRAKILENWKFEELKFEKIVNLKNWNLKKL